jgi:hypothetical protein
MNNMDAGKLDNQRGVSDSTYARTANSICRKGNKCFPFTFDARVIYLPPISKVVKCVGITSKIMITQ